MRTENEVIQAVCEQLVHGIENCGWDWNSDEWAFGECVNMAMDMVVTDEEAMAYPRISYDVKMSVII